MADKKSKDELDKELACIPVSQLFRQVDDVIKYAPPLEPLWGYFLFRKAVTSLIGDPGISKTTLGYSVFSALTNQEPFLGIKPEEPIILLNMDFESSDSLIASRAELIEKKDTPNFYVYNIIDYYLPQIADKVVEFCKLKSVNVIIIDNQSMAFNTRDENDNSEAKREMRFIRQLAVECNTSILIYHHPSKANLPGTRKGSGAYARARLADVMINLDYVSEENKDIIVFSTVKNRMVGDKVLWYLKKENGQFVFTDPPPEAYEQATNTLLYQAQEVIMSYIMEGQNYTTGELVNVAKINNIDEYTVKNAIHKLKQQRRIMSPRYGYYSKVIK